MKTGKALAELSQELLRQAATKKDYLADTRALTVRPADNGLILDGVNGSLPIRATEESGGKLIEFPGRKWADLLA